MLVAEMNAETESKDNKAALTEKKGIQKWAPAYSLCSQR